MDELQQRCFKSVEMSKPGSRDKAELLSQATDVVGLAGAGMLIFTTAPWGFSSSRPPGWMIDGFREALLPACTHVTTCRCIYISARDAGSRKFVNDEDIIACLEGLVFEAVEMSNYGFNEKKALFAQAEMIVGLTGAV